MYPHVFPPNWIKGFCYNFFHPLQLCGIDENWEWGEIVWLKKAGGKGVLG